MVNCKDIAFKATEHSYEAGIPLLGIYLKAIKSLNQRVTCITMFVVTLFTKPRYGINQGVYIIWMAKENMV